MVETLVAALNEYYRLHQPADKAAATAFLKKKLDLVNDKSVYLHRNPQYAIRFCYSRNETFSNTVLSLKTLLKHDDLPVIVCLIRANSYQLFLANTTLINKASHSSQGLQSEKIVGSFTGSDILREFGDVANLPVNFATLFELHSNIETKENLTRIIENTSNISATKTKATINEALREQILKSIRLCFSPAYQSRFATIQEQLDAIVAQNTPEIIRFARQEPTNINIRGNKIEQIITGSINEHKFEDYRWIFDDGIYALIDIKTHIVGLGGNPKHQNIEKFLMHLSKGNVLSFIYFVIIDLNNNSVRTVLINNLEKNLTDKLRIQHHWAGRDSRGVTQIDNEVHVQIDRGWVHVLEQDSAVRFIDNLIAR